MKKPLLFSFLVFLSVLPVKAQEQWYLISEPQIQSIETSLTKSEKDRQSWELQAKELKIEANTLNNQLRTERQQYKILEMSYNKLEISHLEEMKIVQKEKQEAEEALSRGKVDHQKTINQRNIIAAIFSLYLLLSIILFLMRKYLFKR